MSVSSLCFPYTRCTMEDSPVNFVSGSHLYATVLFMIQKQFIYDAIIIPGSETQVR